MALFVIPMAGLSSRFFAAGFEQPKYQLDLHGQSMFRWAVSSFARYFEHDQFLFIIRDVYQTKSFIEQEIAAMGIRHAQIVVLDAATQGQAETVYLGLQHTTQSNDLIIFNIDSRRHDYIKPAWMNHCDGYLEVFAGEGDHWSFAQADAQGRVLCTAEKQRISPWCSNGLYYFRQRQHFEQAFLDAVAHQQQVRGEWYIAPLYNRLIQQGLDIRMQLIDLEQIDFCGTPDEYLSLLAQR